MMEAGRAGRAPETARGAASTGTGERRSLAEVQGEIVAEMASLDGPLSKYEYLVRLGRELDAGDGSLRQARYAVPGCQARVWIRTALVDGRLRIEADAEAMITRGMVALLLRVLDGRTPAEVAGAELSFLDDTGLRSHLSPSRANGLAEMVRRIRELARDAAA